MQLDLNYRPSTAKQDSARQTIPLFCLTAETNLTEHPLEMATDKVHS